MEEFRIDDVLSRERMRSFMSVMCNLYEYSLTNEISKDVKGFLEDENIKNFMHVAKHVNLVVDNEKTDLKSCLMSRLVQVCLDDMRKGEMNADLNALIDRKMKKKIIVPLVATITRDCRKAIDDKIRSFKKCSRLDAHTPNDDGNNDGNNGGSSSTTTSDASADITSDTSNDANQNNAVNIDHNTSQNESACLKDSTVPTKDKVELVELPRYNGLRYSKRSKCSKKYSRVQFCKQRLQSFVTQSKKRKNRMPRLVEAQDVFACYKPFLPNEELFSVNGMKDFLCSRIENTGSLPLSEINIESFDPRKHIYYNNIGKCIYTNVSDSKTLERLVFKLHHPEYVLSKNDYAASNNSIKMNLIAQRAKTERSTKIKKTNLEIKIEAAKILYESNKANADWSIRLQKLGRMQEAESVYNGDIQIIVKKLTLQRAKAIIARIQDPQNFDETIWDKATVVLKSRISRYETDLDLSKLVLKNLLKDMTDAQMFHIVLDRLDKEIILPLLQKIPIEVKVDVGRIPEISPEINTLDESNVFGTVNSVIDEAYMFSEEGAIDERDDDMKDLTIGFGEFVNKEIQKDSLSQYSDLPPNNLPPNNLLANDLFAPS